MPRVPNAVLAGAEALAKRDRVLRRAYKDYGPPELRNPRPKQTHFAELARAICFQQLAGRAAETIHGRFAALFDDGIPTVAAVLVVPEQSLRGAGLSGAKAASIRDLAVKVDEGVVELDRMHRLTDSEVVGELTLVRGIGEWTAQMFLMFQLGRLDVWPVGDLGVRAGFARSVRPARPADGQGARARRRALPSLPLAGGVLVLARDGHGRPGMKRCAWSLLRPARAAGRRLTVAACSSDDSPTKPIAIYGDSLTHGAQSYLEAAADDADATISVTGVPGAALCDLRSEIEQTLRDHPPAALVLVFAGNNSTACAGGRVGAPLVDLYAEDATAIVALAAEMGVPVVLAGPPAIEPEPWATTAELLNDRFRTIADQHDGVDVPRSRRGALAARFHDDAPVSHVGGRRAGLLAR